MKHKPPGRVAKLRRLGLEVYFLFAAGAASAVIALLDFFSLLGQKWISAHLPGLALGSSGLLLGLIATILVKFGALERKAATYMRADVLEKLNELEVDPDLDVIIGQHVAGLVGRAQRVFKANACLTVSGISD